MFGAADTDFPLFRTVDKNAVAALSQQVVQEVGGRGRGRESRGRRLGRIRGRCGSCRGGLGCPCASSRP